MNTQVLKEITENLDTEGFDLQAGQTWIYPTNYPIRNYQLNIVMESLYKNTLVSLPTGLGKTFLAAVVMFNFYRWYPSGKIVFMAPTKPLVNQQMQACYHIMAVPKEVTAELTGTKAQTSRKEIWMSKRVFFITPQVLQNDLTLIPELGKQIKCVVIDEAHKAKGNHAYCEVLRQIVVTNKHFRVLALSATPGSTISDVTEIITNLLISHLEIRTDDSPDVMPYVFQRTMETIVVPLGEKLQSVKHAYLQILERYTRILVENRVIAGNNCANLTKGRMFMILKEFQEKNRHSKIAAYGDIMRNLNLCITLYHGYELLTRHGLRAFLNYFEEHSDQALLRGNVQLHDIMANVHEYLGPQPSIDMLPDGRTPEISPLTKFGHPKFYKLQELLLNHFSNPNNSSSKVIVFTEYKASVKEIFALLVQHSPVIKPRYFLGQSSITQKQQIKAIKSFRSGECNTLISTCIGEEGLDIGDVDLIVCFDISNKSPIRLVQRMGRTGRKKEGKIVALVTAGKEEEILKECLINKHYLSKNILKSKEIHANLFQHNPRMIPKGVIPSCQKIHMSVPVNTKPGKKGNLRELLNNLASCSKSPTLSQLLPDVEVIEMRDRIPDTFMIWDKGKTNIDVEEDDKISFSKRLETLRVSQATNVIGNSRNCDILTSLLRFADSKRYNIPITQMSGNDVISTGNKKSKFGRHKSSDNYKQSDIRTMFMKSQATTTQVNTNNETENSIIKDIQKHYTNDIANELHNEISAYLSLSCIEDSNCKICDNLFICYRTKRKTCDIQIDTWIQPDLSVLNSLNSNTISSFKKLLNPGEGISDNLELDVFADFTDKDWDEFDTSYQGECDKSRTFTFEAPKSTKKIMEKSNILENDINYDYILTFLKLHTIMDIFSEFVDDERIDQSPIISSSRVHSHLSPILSSCDQTRRIRSSRKLFVTKEESADLNTTSITQEDESGLNNKKPNLSNLYSATKSNFFKSKKENPKLDNSSKSTDYVNQLLSNINDFCDMSIFGLEVQQKSSENTEKDGCDQFNKEDFKETSNSGSEDLFGSSRNSPELNDNNIGSNGADIKVLDKTQTTQFPKMEDIEEEMLVAMNYFDERVSPVFDSMRTISQKYQLKESDNMKKMENKEEIEGNYIKNILLPNNNLDISQVSPAVVANNADDSILIENDVFEEEFSPVLNSWEIQSEEYSIKTRIGREGSVKSTKNKSNEVENKQKSETLTVFDICDLSSFGIKIPETPAEKINITKQETNSKSLSYLNNSQAQHIKDTSQVSITQILNIISKYATPQKQDVSCSDSKETIQITPPIKNRKMKQSTSSNKRRALSDDDFIEEVQISNTSKIITQREMFDKKKQIRTKRKRPPSPVLLDSEDEFEKSPFKKNGWISVKKPAQSTSSRVVEEKPKRTNVKKKRKKIPKTYIDDEAILTSSDEAAFKDSQSEPSSSDVFDTSFVDDEALDTANTTHMQAKYLQSTRSPLLNKGAFKIPELRPVNREIIFSQDENTTNETYLNDTFCVNDDIDLTQNEELSDLELAEMVLEECGRKKSKTEFNKRKRTKVMALLSDSD